MQSLGFLFLAAAVATTSALSVQGPEEKMSSLISAALDYMEAQSAIQDPSYRNEPEDYECQDQYCEGKYTISNVTLSGVSNMQVESVRIHPTKLAAHVKVVFPNITLQGLYDIHGTAKVFGHEVSGKGKAKFHVLNTSLHLLYISFAEEAGKGLVAKEAMIHPDVGDIEVSDVEGLTVKGMTVGDFKNALVLEVYGALSKMLSMEIMLDTFLPRAITKDINGRTMEQVIQWFKDHKNDPMPPSTFLSSYIQL